MYLLLLFKKRPPVKGLLFTLCSHLHRSWVWFKCFFSIYFYYARQYFGHFSHSKVRPLQRIGFFDLNKTQVSLESNLA